MYDTVFLWSGGELPNPSPHTPSNGQPFVVLAFHALLPNPSTLNPES